MSLAEEIKLWIKGATEMVFPAVCEVCGQPLIDGEEFLCLNCRHKIPRVNAHVDETSEIHRRLAQPGIPIERTASFFYYFRNNPYARLIQEAKYNDRPNINAFLGRMFATELSRAGFFDGIEALQPVPLHWWKKFRRGYNQAEIICRGISEISQIPIADNLKAARHSTQTRKNALQRQANVAGTMSIVRPEEISGKHILLVDDVITTGATLLATAQTILREAPGTRISVLSLGLTKMA